MSTFAESLADLWETVRPGSIAAANWRAQAEAERTALRTVDVDQLIDDLREVMHGIGEPSTRAKHNGPPCTKHVECFAATIDEILETT